MLKAEREMLEVSEKNVALPTAREVQVMAWWVSEGSCR